MWMKALPKGTPVRVAQVIDRREGKWTTRAEGVLESCGFEETGAWFAHGKRAKLWLPRLHIRKPDGEITVLAMDRNSVVEPLDLPAKVSLINAPIRFPAGRSGPDGCRTA